MRLSVRHYAIAAASASALAVLLWAALARDSNAPPAVLLITIDTLRADHLSAYGYARQTSPNLDALAAQGALFEVAYSEANSTNPSHTTILTGTPMQTHGVIETPQGHLNRDPSGLGRGFDHYVDVAAATERSANASVRLARKWIAGHADRPFFLWLHLFDPYALYAPPPPYDARVPSAPSPRIDVILGRITREEFFRTHPMSAEEQKALIEQFSLPFERSVGFNKIGVTASELARLTALYDGEISHTDAMLSNLFADLGRLGLEDRTLVVVTADHGEALGEHGFFCSHRTIYEETMRIPLILRYPERILPGQRLQVPVHHIDVAPTILEYAGLPLSGPLIGEGLAPILSNGASLSTRPIAEQLRRLHDERFPAAEPLPSGREVGSACRAPPRSTRSVL